MLLRQRKKLIVLFLILVASMIVAEFTLDTLLLGLNGGTPITKTGTVIIDDVPTTDVEFVATATTILQELGWWQNDAYLLRLSRKLDCSQVDAPPRTRLLSFRRIDRITLFAEGVHYATMEFADDGTKLNYRLENYGVDKIRPSIRFDLTAVQIGSDDALKQAELSGGKVLRNLVNNECYIHMDIAGDQNWEIDYSQRNPFERLLCLDVDLSTGKVNQIPERSLAPCRYFTP